MNRLRFYMLLCWLALCVCLTPAVQRRTASKEVKSKLFMQLLAEDREFRECVEQEPNGSRAAEELTSVEEVDLNRDGVPEYEVGPTGACACGMVNCSIYLYRKTADGYDLILEDASGMGLELLKTYSNGFRDLRVDARNNAATYSSSIYKFDGKKYRETSSRMVEAETGASKPSYRRVQFKRGMSSTTVQGRASITLPDTYLVGARAGQVMTVQLTSARQSVKFMLMNSKSHLLADNTRSWSGPLPETGDYTILVEGDEKGGTYSMTITIK